MKLHLTKFGWTGNTTCQMCLFLRFFRTFDYVITTKNKNKINNQFEGFFLENNFNGLIEILLNLARNRKADSKFSIFF